MRRVGQVVLNIIALMPLWVSFLNIAWELYKQERDYRASR